ncbi:MAG: hypothetical protein DSY43_01840 [Gammaproteobacteria bacterium]|uniref:Uncharacterized protein n=1 Tax=endosymbiont of Bathymodiolus septemdierum str. Myojin knoll TaxID=1303921 RepID=A0A0P0US08_9GAMM|nr:hypothetical protein [Bathymodiolus septemdierum thioautotrophic gill symbiont]RUA06547.1 MAG: hypothetical protein DSY43_01840 [Gammaproteobacteria bacterium]BAS67640.1 hypothetical protein BSEPE_0642 [endosymbiont of Bathymodiolus septemdierum str. Myojin knoll]
MPHWKTKDEITLCVDGISEQFKNIVFVDDKGNEFATMFDASEEYEYALSQGVEVSNDEIIVINFLSKHYPTETAIDVVTAFRFQTADDKVDAKYMLAPTLKEARQDFDCVDSQDIKEFLFENGFSASKFAKEILVSERTIQHRFNINDERELSLSEKYLAKVLLYSK